MHRILGQSRDISSLHGRVGEVSLCFYKGYFSWESPSEATWTVRLAVWFRWTMLTICNLTLTFYNKWSAMLIDHGHERAYPSYVDHIECKNTTIVQDSDLIITNVHIKFVTIIQIKTADCRTNTKNLCGHGDERDKSSFRNYCPVKQ